MMLFFFNQKPSYECRISHWSSDVCSSDLKDELLRTADVATIRLVLSDRTRGLIGARELGLMKPSALLVNTSRGPIVDEAALLDALRNRRIGGAAIDAYGSEPLPPDHPLRRTEHGSASCRERGCSEVEIRVVSTTL